MKFGAFFLHFGAIFDWTRGKFGFLGELFFRIFPSSFSRCQVVCCSLISEASDLPKETGVFNAPVGVESPYF